MPTLRRSVFNPGGSWESDGLDQSEAFNAELNERRRMEAQRRLDQQMNIDREDSWRMADIRERGRQFDAGRGDARDARSDLLKMRMAELDFGREGRQAEESRFGKQFDYMRGRDEREDSWRRETWGADKATRDAQGQVMSAQAQAMLAALARMEEETKRRNAAGNAAAPTDMTPDEAAQAAALAASGQSQAEVNVGLRESRKARAARAAGALEEDFAMDAEAFNERDNAWFGDDPEGGSLIKKIGAIQAKLEESGLSPEEAKAQARVIARKALAKGGDAAAAVKRALGIQTE